MRDIEAAFVANDKSAEFAESCEAAFDDRFILGASGRCEV